MAYSPRILHSSNPAGDPADFSSSIVVLNTQGVTATIGTPSVIVTQLDNSGYVLAAYGTTVPTDADSGYATGAIFRKTNGSSGTTLYVNEGTSSSATFRALDTAGGFNLPISATDASSTSGTSFGITSSALTTGNGLSVTANAITTGNAIAASSTSAVWTSANLLDLSLTSSSATLATATGAIAQITYSMTGTATSGTVSPTNNALLIQGTMVQNGAGGTLSPSGALLQITGVSTQTAGTLTDTRSAIAITVPSGMTGAPISLTQNNVTSTNYKKLATLGGITLWMTSGTTPNGNLTGAQGDVCFNAAGSSTSTRMYICTGAGTTWTAVTTAA